MGMVVNQYNVYLVNLDPTVGHEIKKTREPRKARPAFRQGTARKGNYTSTDREHA